MTNANFNTRENELQSARNEEMRVTDKKKADRAQRRLEREARNQALRSMQANAMNAKGRA